MTDTLARPAADPLEPTAWARALYDRQIAMLSELAQDSFALAKAIKEEALASGEAAAASAPHARAARAVRLSLMLQDRVIRHVLGEEGASAPSGGKAGLPDPGPITRIIRTLVAPGDPLDLDDDAYVELDACGGAPCDGDDDDGEGRPERLDGEGREGERLDREDLRPMARARPVPEQPPAPSCDPAVKDPPPSGQEWLAPGSRPPRRRAWREEEDLIRASVLGRGASP